MKHSLLHRGGWQILSAIILAIFVCATFLTPAKAQERILKTLTVTGQGKEMISATLADVSLGVEIKGETAAQVQQQVANQTTAVVNLLRDRNVDRLKTAGIRLNPQYDYNNNQRRFLGYLGSNTVSFRVKTEAAGKLMDDAVKAGATKIDRISFTATDSAIATAQKVALKKATQDAQAQAEAVLSSLNLSRKDVISIQVNGASAPSPRPLANFARAQMAAADASTPVVGGEQTVRGSVTLQISY